MRVKETIPRFIKQRFGKMKELNTVAAEQLFLDYIAYYEERWLQGKLSPCNEEATKKRAKHILQPASCLCEEFGGATLYSIIATYLQKHNDREGDSLKHVIRAFEFLELVAVNLFLSPWRKEIKSLKTFTGNFVYNVRSVLPETVVKGILQKLGYSALTATEFLLTEKINERKSQEIAFQIFCARIECHLILELSNGGKTCDLLKFLTTRAAVHGKNEVEEQEKKTTFKHDPQSLVNANIKKTNTWPISKQSLLSKDGLPLKASEGKARGHFESDKFPTTSTTDIFESESMIGLVLDSKEAYNTKQSADCNGSRKGMHISDSDESRRISKLTHCSELHGLMRNNQGLSSSTCVEDQKIDSKCLNSSKTAEKTNLGSNGLGTSKSTTENTKMDSKGMSPSKSAENKGMNPSKSAENTKMDSKGMSPSKSAENKGMNPSKSAEDIKLDSKGMNQRMDNKGLNTSRSNENTEMDSNGQHSSKSAESIRMGIEGFSSLKLNKDRNLDSSGKDRSESGEVRRVNSMFDSESAQDKRDSIGTNHSDSAADLTNKEATHISNPTSESFGVGSTGQSTDKSSASKSLAAECFHSTRSESEEFLTQYSDINIGQKPLFKDDGLQKYKKLKEKKSRPGFGATVLEEASTAEPTPQKSYESVPQTFAFCTDAKADGRTGEPKAVPEKCDFTDSSTVIIGSPLFKPLDAETDVVKNKNTLSPSIIHVAQHNLSNKDDCELASLISKLNICENVENLQYPVEESTSNESEILKNSPRRNSKKAKQAMIDYSHPICHYASHNNVAKCDHILHLDVYPKEVHCGSTKKPGIDTAATEKSTENCAQVREPPRSTYIPPEGFKNQPLDDSYETAHFYFPNTKSEQDNTKSEQDPSIKTMPDGDCIFQMNEDPNDDFVLISHHSASKD